MVEYASGQQYSIDMYQKGDWLCIYHARPYYSPLCQSVKGATDMASSGDDSFKSDQHHSSERKKRKDAGRVRWQGRDYYAIEWIGVQGVIRFDQLQQLLGM